MHYLSLVVGPDTFELVIVVAAGVVAVVQRLSRFVPNWGFGLDYWLQMVLHR